MIFWTLFLFAFVDYQDLFTNYNLSTAIKFDINRSFHFTLFLFLFLSPSLSLSLFLSTESVDLFCFDRIHPVLWAFFLTFVLAWFWQFLKLPFLFIDYREVRQFYHQELQINEVCPFSLSLSPSHFLTFLL